MPPCSARALLPFFSISLYCDLACVRIARNIPRHRENSPCCVRRGTFHTANFKDWCYCAKLSSWDFVWVIWVFGPVQHPLCLPIIFMKWKWRLCTFLYSYIFKNKLGIYILEFFGSKPASLMRPPPCQWVVVSTTRIFMKLNATSMARCNDNEALEERTTKKNHNYFQKVPSVLCPPRNTNNTTLQIIVFIASEDNHTTE